MPFELKITNGAEEVNFLSEEYMLTDGGLAVTTPEEKEVWGGDSIYAHGSQLISAAFKNREAKLTFAIKGATRDELLGRVARVDRILESAKRRSIDEAGPRVEFSYAWEGSAEVTYYEVVSGRLEWPGNVMSVEGVHQKDGEGNWVIYDFELTLTLYPFAYPISPVSGTPSLITLSNRFETSTKVQVSNALDVTHDNYVEISGDELVGSFPAVVKLELTNLSGEAERTSKVYIGVRKGDQGFKAILDDADAAFRIGGVTPIADADYSNRGTYSVLAFSGTDEQILARWDLTDVEMEATQGPFRIFGRTKDNTYWDDGANFALAVMYNDVLLYQTEWRTPLNTTTMLFDFGTVFLPPWLGSMTDLAGLSIVLKGMRKLAGDSSVSLDYLALLPQDGGYRVLQFRGGGMAEAESLVDDGWERAVYHLNLDGKKSGLPFGLMQQITLQPGVTHRLYFLMEGTAGSTEISRRLDVSVSIVPSYMVLA